MAVCLGGGPDLEMEAADRTGLTRGGMVLLDEADIDPGFGQGILTPDL